MFKVSVQETRLNFGRTLGERFFFSLSDAAKTVSCDTELSERLFVTRNYSDDDAGLIGP
jgi:hypothetical protein